MKKIFNNVLCLFVILVLLNSCASIKVTTIKNSSKKISDAQGFMIYFNSIDLELRNRLEKEIQEELRINGKNSCTSITVFPPIKDYSQSEVIEGCLNNNCNYKITIVNSDTSIETGYLLMYGVLIPSSSTSCSFDVVIQDILDNEIVMRSTVNTEGDELKYITKSIAKKIVKEIMLENSKE